MKYKIIKLVGIDPNKNLNRRKEIIKNLEKFNKSKIQDSNKFFGKFTKNLDFNNRINSDKEVINLIYKN